MKTIIQRKMRLPVAAILFALSSCGHALAQTASDYIATGLSDLKLQSTTGLQNADAAFASALQLEPANQKANTLKAVTGVALLQSQPAFQNLLTAIGVQNIGTGPDIYHCFYALVTGSTGQYSPPPGASSRLMVTYVSSGSVQTALSNSIANLKNVTQDFSLQLTPEEAGGESVAVDYGDVQIALGSLYTAKALTALANTYNVTVSLNKLAALNSTDSLTLSEVIKTFPSLLKMASGPDQRATAVSYLLEASAAYQAGSNFILTTRTTNTNHLFQISNTVKEQDLLTKLAALGNSLANGAVTFPTSTVSPTPLDGQTINLKALVATTATPRSLLGTSVGNFFLENTWPDPSLGGSLPGGTETEVNALASYLHVLLPVVYHEILWQNGNSVTAWLISGSSYLGNSTISADSTGWQVKAVADLYGDGQHDIIWQNGNQVAAWLMIGTNFQSAANITTNSGGWVVKAVADINGNGQSEIIWQKGNQVEAWLMNGTTFQSSVTLTTNSGGLEVKALTSFNGDGQPDIIWQKGDSVTVWLMNGTTFQSAFTLTNAAGGAQVKGVADLYGFGLPNIIWQKGNSVYVWLMNGTTFQSSVTLTDSAGGWKVEGAQ